MKKIINDPAQYTDDMLKGIYRAHSDQVGYVNNDLRCYCTKKKVPGKVSIITGGGTGHLPLFLGYVGENLLDGCAVGSVFQSPSAEHLLLYKKNNTCLSSHYGCRLLHLRHLPSICLLYTSRCV